MRYVHTLLPSVLQGLVSRGIEALIRILEKVLNCRHELIIGPILLPSQVCFCPCWGTENSHVVPNQETMECDQPVQIHSHAQHMQPQICVQDHCPGEEKTSFVRFPDRLEMSLVLLFKVLNYLSIVGLSGRKQCS